MAFPERLTYQAVKARAKERGFSLVTRSYRGSTAVHTFRCPQGHRIAAAPFNIFRGMGCRVCNIIASRNSIETIRELARSRDGYYLSPTYERASDKALWACYYGHTWSAKSSNIMCGSWCPHCYRIRVAHGPRWGDVAEVGRVERLRKLGIPVRVEKRSVRRSRKRMNRR